MLMKKPLVTRKRLPDGTFGEPEKVFPEVGETLEEKAARLDAENADVWFENIVLNSRVEAAEQEVAELWFAIITGGA